MRYFFAQFLNFFSHLWQATELCLLSLDVFERPCRCSPKYLPGRNTLACWDAALGTDHAVVVDAAIVSDPNLSPDHGFASDR